MIGSGLLISGCADKQTPKVQDDKNLSVPEVHKRPVHDAHLKPPAPRPTTQPEKTVPTKDNTVAAQAAQQEIRTQTNRAEQAAASAEQARAKARSASTAAEQAASKAEQAAAAGDSQQAATAADATTASAAAAKEAATAARQHANQAQQHAQSATAATTAATAGGAKDAATAAEKADSAARSAFGHSLLAAQQAKRAQEAVEMAGKVAVVTAGASQVGGSAKRASTQSKIAKAKAQGAQKAAATGDLKTAGAEAGKAQKAADQAAVDARQANERLGELKKTVGSITSDKRSAQGVRDAAGNALADARRSADAAQAAALAARKSALNAKQLLQRAEVKAKQPKPTTKPGADPTSRPSTRPVPKPLTRPADKIVLRPKGGDIDMTKLPKLPKLPPRKTTPKGIITPKAPKAAVVRIKGRWLQVSGSKAADFLPGGYRTSRLVFREDGILQVRRTFDKKGDVSVTWSVGYKWNKDGSMVTIGGDEADRPLKSSLKGFEIEDSGVKALDAADDLPVILKCTRLANGRISLSGRIYKSSAE